VRFSGTRGTAGFFFIVPPLFRVQRSINSQSSLLIYIKDLFLGREVSRAGGGVVFRGNGYILHKEKGNNMKLMARLLFMITIVVTATDLIEYYHLKQHPSV